MNSEENYKPIHDIKKAITSLKKLSTEFCEILNSIDESTLNTKIKHGNVTLIDFISSSIRHDVWHAGQIALLRRLYKHYHQ